MLKLNFGEKILITKTFTTIIPEVAFRARHRLVLIGMFHTSRYESFHVLHKNHMTIPQHLLKKIILMSKNFLQVGLF